MKVGIIDVDGRKFPNLALMKLSAYHKTLGDSVEWYSMFSGRYDVVYQTKVFSFTSDYLEHVNANQVIRGGTGYAIKTIDGKEHYVSMADRALPYEIEHIYPDYGLYPELTKDTAMGFLTRGCLRACLFCIVSGKEGRRSVKVANIDELWNGQKHIILLDPNILACPDWRDLLTQCKDTGAEIDFNQGLDVRLMTPEKANLLGEIKVKQIHFAWDRYQDKDKVFAGLQIFKDNYGKYIYSHDVMVYTIVNFDTTFEQDLERIYTLRDMGFWPYVMIYRKYKCDPRYRRLARWVNNRFIFFRCERFEDYDKVEVNTPSGGPLLL